MATQVQVQKHDTAVVESVLNDLWHVSLTIRNVFPRFETWRRAVNIVLTLVKHCDGCDEGLTVFELSRLTGIHHSTMKHYVEKLCSLGLIRKRFALKKSGNGYICVYSANATSVLQKALEILQGEIEQKQRLVRRIKTVLSQHDHS